MSKNLIIGLVVIALVTFGYYYLSPKSSDSMMVKDTPKVQDSMVKTDDTVMEKKADDAMMKDASNYVKYSQQVLESSATKRRVLYFYASWCPTCIPANADFEKNVSMIPEDAVVIRVNYNDPDTDAEEKALATKYGITYQHTFVQIDSKGEVVTQWNGGSIKELLAKIK